MNDKQQQNIKLEELGLRINVIEDDMIGIYQGFLEERDVLASRIKYLEETVKEMKGGEE